VARQHPRAQLTDQPFELGIAADGWIEVTKGLDNGSVVRLPG